MNDRLRSRLAMFKASLTVLNMTNNKPIWQNQPPTIFTKKVAATEQAVANLEADGQVQGADITGVTVDKKKEEKDLEQVCILYGGTVAMWYRDRGDEANAEKIDLNPSDWEKISEQELLDKSRLLRDLMQSIVDTAPAEEAAEWGITAEAVASITKESDEFDAAIADPQAVIAERKAQTAALRPKFRAVAAKFADLDRLILHFAGTEAGQAMIAAYQNARNIIDRGKGSSATQDKPDEDAV